MENACKVAVERGGTKKEEEEMFCTQLCPFVNKNDDAGAEYGQKKRKRKNLEPQMVRR